MQNSVKFRTRQLALTLAASTAICLTSPSLSPAWAIDAVSFFKAIQAEVEKDGNVMTFESLDATGGDGARATGIEIVDDKKGERITIAEMSLSGTRLLGDEAFSFETMEASDFRFFNDDGGQQSSTLSIGQVSASGFEVPPDADRSNPFWPLNVESGRLQRVQLIGAGDGNFSLNIPSIAIEDLGHSEGTEYRVGSVEMAASTGSFADEKGANASFSLGEISIKNAARLGQSGFLIGAIDFGAINANGVDEKDRDIALGFEGLSATNIYSPDYSADESLIFPKEPAVADIGSLSFSLDQKEIFSMTGGKSRANFDAESNVYAATGSIDDLTVDFTALPDDPSNARAKAQMKTLGYDKAVMDISVEGGWNVMSGLLNLDSYKFDLEEMGALDLSMRLGGYTVDFARKMQEISTKMNATKDRELQSALSMQILAEMSALTVEEMKIQLDDKSLTRRIMEMQAKQSGQTAEDMASAVPFMAGMMLAQLDIPDFAASLSAALGTFLTSSLSNNGSITVSATPDEPVSFVEIMGIAAGVEAGNVDAQEVIDRFNLSVEGR